MRKKSVSRKNRHRQPSHNARGKISGRAVRIVARAKLPTRYGAFTILGAEGTGPQEAAVILTRGHAKGATNGGKGSAGKAPLVRIHSQCLTGDVFTSQRCDCRAQLELSLRKIGAASHGVLLYLPQEGRGIGLMNKLRAYELQDRGMDTVEANEELGFAADSRDYSFSAAVLRKMGIRRVRLLSNNPDKVEQLEKAGIRVVERIPCQPRASSSTRSYLTTKKTKLGHILSGF
ncbi:MAG TPA: GTP cyclohydrolase II [Candidatus Acidoferrales bacterium]|jgi:GTP cyclohydrolase II|nr:GTP cyclohydrolase II [Candidatus Acidoferrales bacterium]